MRLTILSDIHDNIWKLDEVLAQASEADVLIFCGDFCAPFTLNQIAQGAGGPVHAVWGNNDGDNANNRDDRARKEGVDGGFDQVFVGGCHLPSLFEKLPAA